MRFRDLVSAAGLACMVVFLLAGCQDIKTEKRKPRSTEEKGVRKDLTGPSAAVATPSPTAGEVLDLRSSAKSPAVTAAATASAEASKAVVAAVETSAPVATMPALETPRPTASPEPAEKPGAVESATSAAATAAPTETTPAAEATTEPASPVTTPAETPTEPEAAAKTPDGEAPRLDSAASPYLRNSAKSQVNWYQWSPQAFALAQKLDRPVLINIGANWCHWCRSMDTETYEDKEVAGMVNESFVAIKVDRDERPDIDNRYQVAHFLVNQRGGGWPLTVFALPDGRMFESLAYVPAKTEGENVGMIDVLKQVIDLYKNRRDELVKQASLVERGVATSSRTIAKKGTDAEAYYRRVFKAIVKLNDRTNGGFGDKGEPKFPNGGALLFLLHYQSDFSHKDTANDIIARSLNAYLKCGLRDSVMGGFFRYSVKDDFSRPHFEKMLYVQSELLSSFAQTYAATGQRLLKEGVREILRYSRETLESRDGGFYASQDADYEPSDNGAYYTWSQNEVEKIAGSGTDSKVFLMYYNMSGDAEARQVLRTTKKLADVAKSLNISYEDAQDALDTVRAKLHEQRIGMERIPRVDKTIIAAYNGPMISAYLDVYRYLGDEEARTFALKSADFIMENMVSEKDGVAHSFLKGKAQLHGMLDDQVQVAAALIDCYEISSDSKYLSAAESIMKKVEESYLDAETGLYKDRLPGADDQGLVKLPRLEVYDNPTPSSNATASIAWSRLAMATGNKEYAERARRLVNAVVGLENVEGLAAGTFGRAALLADNGGPRALIVGKAGDEEVVKMHKAALGVFRPGKFVQVLSAEEAEARKLKPGADGKPVVYVCVGDSCSAPITDPGKIGEVLGSVGKRRAPAAPSSTESAKESNE